MGKTVNLISDFDFFLRTSAGNWQVSNAVVGFDLDNVVDERFGSLFLQPLEDGQPVVLSLSGIPISQIYANDTCQFHARQKSSSTCVTTITLTNSNLDSIVRTERTGIQIWSIIRSDLFPIPDIGESLTVDIEVSICEHNLQPIYFTIPVLFTSSSIFNNIYLRDSFTMLPDVIRQADIDHASSHGLPDFPLARLMELASGSAGDSYRDYFRYQYIDIEAGKDPSDPDTLSAFADPENASAQILPWLAQFAGVVLDNPNPGTTPWGNLPVTWKEVQEDIDPASNLTFNPSNITRSLNFVTATIGSHSIVEDIWISLENSTATTTSFNGGYQITAVDATTISWAQDGADESALTTGTVTVLDTEWSEVEEYAPSFDGLLDYLRWQVKYAYNGINGGTEQALIDSVSRELTGDKIVTITTRFENNPWKMRVRTKTSETPDGSDGSSSSVIESYIAKVKPAGFEIIHECTSTGV